MEATKILLPEKEIPTQWHNIAADMPNPAQPPLHPGTGQPIGPDDLVPLFPMALILQEVSQDRWVDIPDPIREAYALWRPTPLHPGADLLQVRRGEPPREPQAEHRAGPGVLQQARGRRPGSPPRRAPASGGAPSPATSSASPARSTWSG